LECYCWGNPNKHCRLQLVGLGFGGTAQQEAKQSATKSVNDRLAKICVYQFGKDPEKDMKLKELKGRSSWNRGDYLKNQGWATMPGEEEPDHGVAEKCVELLIQSSY